MIKRNYIFNKEDIPINWNELILVIWEEDDAITPDKERLNEAFERICGKHEQKIITIDEGDIFHTFYRNGWVKCLACERGYIGILTKETINLQPLIDNLSEKLDNGMTTLEQIKMSNPNLIAELKKALS